MLSLYALAIVLLLAAIAWVFDRQFMAVAYDLWPAVVVCLVATIAHGCRHDLSSSDD